MSSLLILKHPATQIWFCSPRPPTRMLNQLTHSLPKIGNSNPSTREVSQHSLNDYQSESHLTLAIMNCFERLMLHHIKDVLSPNVNLYQFTYRANTLHLDHKTGHCWPPSYRMFLDKRLPNQLPPGYETLPFLHQDPEHRTVFPFCSLYTCDCSWACNNLMFSLLRIPQWLDSSQRKTRQITERKSLNFQPGAQNITLLWTLGKQKIIINFRKHSTALVSHYSNGKLMSRVHTFGFHGVSDKKYKLDSTLLLISLNKSESVDKLYH